MTEWLMAILSTSSLLKLIKGGRNCVAGGRGWIGKQKDTNLLGVDGCVRDWTFPGHWTELHIISLVN